MGLIYEIRKGAPNCGLAPKSMGRMGLNMRELFLAIKKGRKITESLEQLIHHNGEDKLVSREMEYGSGRERVPGTQKEFGEATLKRIETGVFCPE